ncbi:chromate transporter [Natronocella acetinitrilica]|uniref:Chromate transporter n=1 Tax=Natronocella acetinitrilica TaxID=414046 RepID=A0AAE3G6R8_9GAMM|nr:chromate efflux transporter [Natronocella acetinitrilica]MCP1676704.1 chromate transporter [Natronocella acetinitrilica]
MALPTPRTHTWQEVFLTFLLLGLRSFGGPVAHLGYYRETFVRDRRWLNDHDYGQLVALCQFLPGPSSSQVGQAIGLQRAGLPGMAAAWLAFTAPSATIMIGLALGLNWVDPETLQQAGWLHGLKLAAVAVVAHAVLSMARSLCPDLPRATIAVVATGVALVWPNPLGQVSALLAGAVLAFLLPMPAPANVDATLKSPISRRGGVVALGVFVAGLLGLPLLVLLSPGGLLGFVDSFYRVGALVFGGGHVMLPLLDREIAAPSGIDSQTFLAGYGVAQALPGPLFSFAGYLGAEALPHMPIAAGLIAVVAIFLPGTLLLLAALPWWLTVGRNHVLQRGVFGINAGVVGLLAAVLWNPIAVYGITGWLDVVIAALAFAALWSGRLPVYLLVPLCALAGWLIL